LKGSGRTVYIDRNRRCCGGHQCLAVGFDGRQNIFFLILFINYQNYTFYELIWWCRTKLWVLQWQDEGSSSEETSSISCGLR
jgi:hypothetical protein